MITTKSSFPAKTTNRTHRSRKHKLHTTPKTEFITLSLSLSQLFQLTEKQTNNANNEQRNNTGAQANS
jgi:hypothetical protein